ncbi:MlaD family protein [Nocardia sp. NPDC057272]|uniref:MlaD family protein n=1 Tax=Nocardia sp. NPDC057272 TaxID=3346079 RepID=UPI00362CE35A
MTKQTMRSRLTRKGKPAPDDATRRRSDIRWGAVGLVAMIVVAAGIAVASTLQTGVRTYTAFLTDAASLRVGDDVRVAGVPSGTVKSLDLESNRVRLQFTVDRKVFVGDQTTLSIRMLTIVGGHYLAVIPAGTKALGSTVIPADRVKLPYSLPRLFQDAIKPVQELDGDVLRQNFGALTAAVEGGPDGFRRMVTAVDTIVGILDQQNAQVSQALTFSDEYISALAANKAVVGKFIDRFRILETLVENNKIAVGAALADLAKVMTQVSPLAVAWNTTLKDPAQPLADSIAKLDELGGKLGALLTSLKSFSARFDTLTGPDGALTVDRSGQTITAPQLCIPVPGRTC